MGTEFDGLLHDELHLILLRKSLEQIDLRRQLMHLLHEIDMEQHLLRAHLRLRAPVRIMNL